MLSVVQITERLEALDEDLASRQNAFATAAEAWYRKLRDREHQHAVAFMGAGGTITERREAARDATALIGVEEEAAYEGLRAAVKVMETRSMIGMALLKSAGRG